jgi:hypothetical protein
MTKKRVSCGGTAGVFQYGKDDVQEKANGASKSRTKATATRTKHKNSGASEENGNDECYADQETVRALTAALTELQREFRDKCLEVEVLQETVAMVSDDFIRSERNLLRADLVIEQLNFKMQAVTFWDWRNDSCDRDGDTADSTAVVDTDPRDREIDLAVGAQGIESDLDKTPAPSKRSYSRGQGQRQPRSQLVSSSSYEDEDSDEDTSSDSDSSTSRGSSSSANRQKPKYKQPAVESEEPAITPRQAAFYRVMWERDLAQTQARQLTHILLEKRAECFYLSEKLSKTTTLVELAYQDDDDYPDTPDTAGQGLKWQPPGTSDGYDLSWLADDTTDSSTGSHDDDDPELTATEMQLDEYCSIETDRAAGLFVE